MPNTHGTPSQPGCPQETWAVPACLHCWRAWCWHWHHPSTRYGLLQHLGWCALRRGGKQLLPSSPAADWCVWKAFGVKFSASIEDFHSWAPFLNKEAVQFEKTAEFCVEAGENVQLLHYSNNLTVLYIPKDLRQNLWSTVINRAWKSGLGFNFIHDVSSAFPFFSCRVKS